MPEGRISLGREIADQAAILAAFFRRDMFRWFSNRVQFAFEIVHVVVSASTMGFLGYIGKQEHFHQAEVTQAGTPDYLTFLLIGNFIMFLTFSAQRNVSRLMLSREFANLYASPARLPVLLVGANAWRYMILFAHGAAILVVGYFAFGMTLHLTDGVIAVIACAFVLMMSFDLISAGIRVATKAQSDPINWVLMITGQLLGGTFFSVRSRHFPRWLEIVSRFHPQRHANDLARMTLGGGKTLREVWETHTFQNFLLASLFFLAIGMLVFRWGFRKARRDGTLGHL